MSRNAKKITKALTAKGYQPREMHWEPVGHACEMCGPEGGWYIEIVLADDQEEYIDTVLAYSTAEALEEIEQLPMAAQAGEGGQDG